MDTKDREELAATLAGLHNMFTMLVRRLAYTEKLDIAELLIDLETVMAAPGQHPATLAVQTDVRECLLGALPLHAHNPQDLPQTIDAVDVPQVAPARRTVGFEPATTEPQAELSLDERLQVQEILLEEALWAHIDDTDHLRTVSSGLYTRLEALQRHATCPPAVLAELYRRADALSELDNTPDALRPALRPFVQPAAKPEGEDEAS